MKKKQVDDENTKVFDCPGFSRSRLKFFETFSLFFSVIRKIVEKIKKIPP